MILSLNLFQTVLLLSKETWGWLMEAHHLKEGLRYATVVGGALYVMTAGGHVMLISLVDN